MITPLSILFISITLGLVHCQSDDTWTTMTVNQGDYRPQDYIKLVEMGFEGPDFSSSISYLIRFENNTLNYPIYFNRSVCVKKLCSDPYCPCIEHKYEHEFIGSNQNKLFGISRGFVPIMDKSCMFSWTAFPQNSRPGKFINIWGYGWKNKHLPPWKTPGQNPFLLKIQTNKPYLFSITKNPTNCSYIVSNPSSGQILASAFTQQEPDGISEGFKFALYFGGDAPATAPISVSYKKPQ